MTTEDKNEAEETLDQIRQIVADADELMRDLSAVVVGAIDVAREAGLRDAFAERAFSTMLAAGLHDTPDELAEAAYVYADAMMRARAKTGSSGTETDNRKEIG